MSYWMNGKFMQWHIIQKISKPELCSLLTTHLHLPNITYIPKKFNKYFKRLRTYGPQTDGWADRRTDGQRHNIIRRVFFFFFQNGRIKTIRSLLGYPFPAVSRRWINIESALIQHPTVDSFIIVSTLCDGVGRWLGVEGEEVDFRSPASNCSYIEYAQQAHDVTPHDVILTSCACWEGSRVSENCVQNLVHNLMFLFIFQFCWSTHHEVNHHLYIIVCLYIIYHILVLLEDTGWLLSPGGRWFFLTIVNDFFWQRSRIFSKSSMIFSPWRHNRKLVRQNGEFSRLKHLFTNPMLILGRD